MSAIFSTLEDILCLVHYIEPIASPENFYIFCGRQTDRRTDIWILQYQNVLEITMHSKLAFRSLLKLAEVCHARN